MAPAVLLGYDRLPKSVGQDRLVDAFQYIGRMTPISEFRASVPSFIRGLLTYTNLDIENFRPPLSDNANQLPQLQERRFHPEFTEQIKHLAGYILKWRGTEHKFLVGSINFVPIEDICSNWNLSPDDWDEEELGPPILKDFHLVDYYAEDRGVGVFAGENARRSLFCIKFSNPIPMYLGINLESYINLAIQCRGIIDWPFALYEYKSKSEEMYLHYFKAHINKVEPDFDIDAFFKRYESMRFLEEKPSYFI